MAYSKKIANGVGYMSILRAVTRGLALLKTVFLARILTPSQFGIYGIATITLGFLETLTETGINIFLIQEKKDIDKYINSAWVISIIRGILIALIIYSFSPFISIFFETDAAITILRLTAVIPFIKGFINPACIKYQKDLEFKKLFLYEGGLSFVDAFFTILIGLIIRNEYSLIYGMITASVLEVILSFKFFRPTPNLILEKEETIRVINRGKWITMAGIFNYLFMHIDDIFVGKMLSTAALGAYQQAYRISSFPVSEVGEIFNKVTFPVFTTMSEDKKRLKLAFLKTLFFITLFVVPIGFFIFKYPVEIVNIVYGKNWVTIAPLLQILVLFGIIKALANSFFSLFLGINKQEIVTFLTLVSIIVLVLLLHPFIKIFGILGAGYATIFASLVNLIFAVYFFIKYTK